MKMSKLFVRTMRENPSDAEVISHKLLARAGYIKKLTSGVYTFLPLMWRVLKKIENIIQEEMDAAGAQELLMPFVQPKELWEESGRWNAYGGELMRLKDRHGREMCLGPTHEEIITSVVRDIIKSYKQLPLNLYQIQSKFRDERRPRFGLLRGREFIMKDAYSFDTSQEGLDKEYKNMWQAYTKIFNRCGLPTKVVQSDSGAIGGNVSHEFMVITDTDAGENDVFYCDNCDYSANSNHAVSVLPDAVVDGGYGKAEIIDTPNVHSIDELSAFLKCAPSVICKALVYIVDKAPVIALIRGDKQIEETKLLNSVGGIDIRIATSEEIAELMKQNGYDAIPGFIGPKGADGKYLSKYENYEIKIVADNTVKDLRNFVIGINQTDKHLVGANWGIDVDLPSVVTDLRLVEEGELCPECHMPLKVTRGIEVGNIFQLGTKYSKPMNGNYLDENGIAKPYLMGCYGIGVTRTAAAAVEAHHDNFGIKWPLSIAPYHAIVVPVSTQDEKQMSVANKIYENLLNAGVEVVIDDRNERPGVKFKDADLIGFPFRITVGKTIVDGNVEFIERASGDKIIITPDEAIKKVIDAVNRIN